METGRRSEPEGAAEDTGPELASDHTGPEAASDHTGPEAASDDTGPEAASDHTGLEGAADALGTISFKELPEAVRSRILAWSALALGGLPAAQIPPALQRVARFTPAKRARMGAGALAGAVQSDPAFRAVVAQFLAAESPDADSLAGDPVGAAARSHVLRLPDEAQHLQAAREWTEGTGERAEVESLRQQVQRLAGRLEEATAELQVRRLAPDPGNAEAEADKLRRRLREQGARLRTAELAASAARQERQAELESLAAQLSGTVAESRNWQDRAIAESERADRAQETVAKQREAATRQRTSADRRLDLLLSTIEGASAGLRREWNLQGGGADPADLIADALPAQGNLPEITLDPARLQAWLSLPGAHLIVDGYNVTKTGFADLTLAQQRERLVRVLAALAARTSADVTAIFDGAAVVVPQPPGRGIRVLFSPPGVIADDVIADLVAAEPRGRVVVVVSSDRDVVRRVRRDGARAAGSPALLALFGG